MIRLLGISICLTVVLCQAFPDVRTDLLNLFYNMPVALRDCSRTDVRLSNIKFTLFTQEDKVNGTVINTTNFNVVNPQDRLIILIHGWLQNCADKPITHMKDAYLNKKSANVITVDWSQYAGINYASSFCAVPQVGSFVGDLIYNLTVSKRAQLNNTQINGFSLGGHVGGFAGQEVQNKTNGQKIACINGLDAAGPGFLGLPLNQRLDASDATIVQGIHTSNFQFGYTPAYATVDFHFNYRPLNSCGAVQPGCPFTPGVPKEPTTSLEVMLPYIFCNHVRAIAYFTESINSTSFVAVKCDSCREYGRGSCNSSPSMAFNENCLSTVSGEYYLSINAISPFATGSPAVRESN